MPESPVLDLLQSRLADLEALTTRTNKVSVMVVQQFPIPEDRGVLFPPVRESIANVMAFAEIGTAFDASWILDYCAATVDLVAADCDQKLRESTEIVRVVRAKISGRRL